MTQEWFRGRWGEKCICKYCGLLRTGISMVLRGVRVCLGEDIPWCFCYVCLLSSLLPFAICTSNIVWNFVLIPWLGVAGGNATLCNKASEGVYGL